jgi:hypothetical protein
MRQQQEPTEPGHTSIAPSHWLRRLTAPHQRSWLQSSYWSDNPRPRYLPLGLRIVFREGAIASEVCLLWYARTHPAPVSWSPHLSYHLTPAAAPRS